LTTPRSRRPRGVVDTSVLVAGISGFRSGIVSSSNPSAQLLRDWIERATFTWLLSEEILSEYKAVLRRLKVRRETIGALINLLREEQNCFLRAQRAAFHLTPEMSHFVLVQRLAMRIFSSHSIREIFLKAHSPPRFWLRANRFRLAG